jgi:hypothetical protein
MCTSCCFSSGKTSPSRFATTFTSLNSSKLTKETHQKQNIC